MTYFRTGEINLSQPRVHPFNSRKRATFVGVLAVSCFFFLGLGSAVAGPDSGDVRGVTCNALGTPVPGVQVSVHSVEDNTDRNVVSDRYGTFAVENLRPGHYQLRAAKGVLASPTVTTVSLEPRQDLRVDMTLLPAAGEKVAANTTLTADLQTPAASSKSNEAPLTDREKMLLDRLDKLEQRLAAMEAKEASATTPAATPTVASAATRAPASVAAPAPPSPATADAKSSVAAVATHPSAPATSAGPAQASPSAPAKPVLVASLGGTTGVNTAADPSTISTQSNTIAASVSSTTALPTLNTPGGTANKNASAPAQEAAPDQKKKIDPFSDADWTWLNGNPRTKDIYWDSKFFTPEIRSDVTATWDNQHPADHSMGGSSELFREGEVQLEQLGIGGDFHYDNVRARFMTQFGAYSTATIRNDGSYANGEWDLADANRYLSEAYGGYHFNWMSGVNVDAGIFMSYIGLFSYYNFDNWAYQPSYVSSNTPWFFQGVRVQIFPTPHLKIEPWYINGWQSYASANNRPGLGGQIKWTPYPWLNIISNNYGLGHDDLYAPGRTRIHTDNSQEILYYNRPKSQYLSKMAVSFTEDLGCEFGNGVSCTGDHAGGPKQSFIGAMVYNRFWFDRDQFAVTWGGGGINNPGRYLVLLPPINGETAASAALNSPYFTENPGNIFKAWDSSLTFDWMPKQYITFRIEPDFRHADIPYWTGRGGITPPAALGASVLTPNGFPSQYACNDGTPAGMNLVAGSCANDGGVWYPSLVKNEFLIDFDIMVKF